MNADGTTGNDHARQKNDLPRQGPTSSVVIVRALEAAVAAAGKDAAAFRQEMGLPAAVLDDVEARVPARVVARAWERAAELTGDPCFGLHLAERVPAGSFDLLEYGVRSCATFGDALRHLGRYFRLLEDAAVIEVEVEGDEARLLHRVVDDAGFTAPRHGVEATLATMLLRGRRVRADFAVREVFFRHTAPAEVAAHRRLFRAPVRFSAPVSGFSFDRRFLDEPQPEADEGLRKILDRQADALLARLPEAADLPARTRKVLLRLLPGAGDVDLDAVAGSLGTSRRSLQRGLAEAGISFQELLAEVRRTLAEEYLRDGRTTIGEIAFLLGFSEPSAFQRAFRRWTGTTPQSFRRAQSS